MRDQHHQSIADEDLTRISREQAKRWAEALTLLANERRDCTCPPCAKAATIKAAEAQANTQTHRPQ